MLDGLFSNKLFPHGTRLYYKLYSMINKQAAS